MREPERVKENKCTVTRFPPNEKGNGTADRSRKELICIFHVFKSSNESIRHQTDKDRHVHNRLEPTNQRNRSTFMQPQLFIAAVNCKQFDDREEKHFPPDLVSKINEIKSSLPADSEFYPKLPSGQHFN